MNLAAIAVNRFGLGARSNEIAPAEPLHWLLAQFEQYQRMPSGWEHASRTIEIVAEIAQTQLETRQANENEKLSARRLFRHDAQGTYAMAVHARAETALTTLTPFIERLVHFWSNHFAISVEKLAVVELAGAFEREAIRPHVLGSFKDLLFAAVQHPAMLLYLDQVQSIGPSSPAALRMTGRHPDEKRGLNENLAREIMELHTLGVRSGYTQTDVTEFARALTGWSIANPNHPDKNVAYGENGFVFRPQIHEPDRRTIMGRSYPQSGKMQAEAVLNDLASAQSTAIHIATKLARHFVSDTPPQSLVDKLAQEFVTKDGDLVSVYRALITSPEAWQPFPKKFKTPWEWFISANRGLGRQNLEGVIVVKLLNQLGQPVWRPTSPAGFDDNAEAWMSPNALLRRVELAQRMVATNGNKIDGHVLADKLLFGAISQSTQEAIFHSESAATGLALLLISPEFLRR